MDRCGDLVSARLLLLVVIAVGATACADGGATPLAPSAPPSSPANPEPPAPPAPDPDPTGPFSGTVPAFGTNRHTFIAPQTGRVTLRLTWPNAAVDLDLYLASSSCQELYPQGACGILVSSVAADGSSEELQWPVQTGDEFAVFVDNLDTLSSQPYTISVTVQ